MSVSPSMGPLSTGLPSAVPVDFTALLFPSEKAEASNVPSFQAEMHSLLANHPVEEKYKAEDSQDSPKDAPATTASLIEPTPIPDNKVPTPPLHFALAPNFSRTASILPVDAPNAQDTNTKETNTPRELPVRLTLPQTSQPVSPNAGVPEPEKASADRQLGTTGVERIERHTEPKVDGTKNKLPTVPQRAPEGSGSGPARRWNFKGIEQNATRKVPANWVSGQKIKTLTGSRGASEAPDLEQTEIPPTGRKEPEQAPREATLPTFSAKDVSVLAPPSPQSGEPLPQELEESTTPTRVKEVQTNTEHERPSGTRTSGGRPGPDKFFDDSVSNGTLDNAPESESPILPPRTPDKPTLPLAANAAEDASAGFPVAAPQAQAVPQVPEKGTFPSAKRSVAAVDRISPNLLVRHEQEPQPATPLPTQDIPMQMPNDRGTSPEKEIPSAMHSSQTPPAGLNEPGIPNTTNPVGMNEAGQDVARKTASTTLAFGARLDLRNPLDNAASTAAAASDPKASQQNPLPRAQKVPAFTPAGEFPASVSSKPDPVLPRAEAYAQVPQRHTPIAFDAVKAPSIQSKDERSAPSLPSTPVESSAAHEDIQVQTPSPSVKPSTAAYNSISANLQLEPRLEPQPASTNSGHDIRVQIPDDRGGATEVRFLETAGEVRVAVRTADSGLAQTLQSGLHELTSRLTSEGIQTEVWRPGSGASSQQNDSSHQSLDPNDSGSGGNGPGDRRRDDSQQDKPRWLQEMEASSGPARQ